MDNITTMSLKEAPFQFATFNPVEYVSTYKPETTNYSLLSHAYQLQENREKEANDKMTKIDATLNQLREELNVSDHSWLSGKSKEIQDRIDTQIALGNYQSAIRIANEEAKGILRDEELNNRRSANRVYEKEKQRVESMSIDPLTKRRWLAENKYSYDGTATWKPLWTPVNDISIASLQSMAFQMTPEDATSSSTEFSSSKETWYDDEGKVTTDPSKVSKSKTVSSSGGKSYSSHKKSKEAMETTFRRLLADSNISLALLQKHSTYVWAYNYLDKRRTDMSLSEEERKIAEAEFNVLAKEITDENGMIIDDYNNWIDSKVIPMFANMEYHNTASGSSSGYGVSQELFKSNPDSPNNSNNSGYTSIPEASVSGSPGQNNNGTGGNSSNKASSFSNLF